MHVCDSFSILNYSHNNSEGVGKVNGIPIQLKQVTEIRDGARKEIVVIEANGLYYLKGDATYVTFEETHEGETIKNVVKIANDEVVVLRSGAISMRHTFRKQSETIGTYESPMARWEMKTKTEQVLYQYNEKTKKGQLFFSYILHLSGKHVGRHAVTISFKEAKR
ncbi:putative beta-barrel protein ywiB [Anoxybacillus thermarum]|uniref:Putative beta-barrel protein ywiB n=1 Tax=Anoxybacillus thermarum TaxID=404937 RepID=A0A0D0RYQ5_9BACL|nr:putative beta-barrel protein ywiB [Anoxybacillus thermarum]